MMDEIRCKKCGLWLERPDSICPRCIAIDGSEEEKRKFYENMDEHSIENAHISSIKKVAETLLRDGQHYTIDPREIINLIFFCCSKVLVYFIPTPFGVPNCQTCVT